MKHLSQKDLDEISKPYKQTLRDKVKDWITDILGLIICVVAIVLLSCKEISVWPDFVIIMACGLILFLIPDSQIVKGIKKVVSKKLG
jgi:hypothetical protein